MLANEPWYRSNQWKQNNDCKGTTLNSSLSSLTFFPELEWWIMSPPTLVGRHIVFVLSVCPSHSLSTQLLWNYWTEFHETWWVVRTPYVVVHIIRKLWSPGICGSYAPLNLEISRNVLLKQLVSATHLKLLNRISWNLVGIKNTICSCTSYQEILIVWIVWELCPFELKNFPKYTSEATCQRNSSETTKHNFIFTLDIWMLNKLV
jgi:hypothetical protein